MSLAEYNPPSRDVPLGTTSIKLVGLSFQAISILVQEHAPDLDTVWALIKKSDVLQEGDVKRLALSLAVDAPGLCANIIALAANEPQNAEQAAKIPAPTQIALLVDIMDMTFTEVGGVKKFKEMVANLLGTLMVKMPSKVAVVKAAVTAAKKAQKKPR